MARRRRHRRRSLTNAVVLVLILALCGWAFIPGIGPDLLQLSEKWEQWGLPRIDQLLDPDPQHALQAAPQTPLILALQELPVTAPTAAPQRETPRYQREAFGPAWADTDHNGCDTRNDILRRDLKSVRFRPNTHNCVVISGQLVDPYTGKAIYFKRGQHTSEAVQIDHVVALGDAWRSGANSWDERLRLTYANDPLVLLAVDGPANQEKGMSAADEWLPSNHGYRCAYVARQVAIKRKYKLSVSKREFAALTRVATTCPDQPLPQN